jgi:hypothetical protein
MIPIFYFVTGLVSANVQNILSYQDSNKHTFTKAKEIYDFLRTKLIFAMLVLFQILFTWSNNVIVPK